MVGVHAMNYISIFIQKYLRPIFTFESSYVLFLFAGVYKQADFLLWSPIDLTLLFGLIIVTGILIHILYYDLVLTRVSTSILGLYFIFVFYSIISGLWSSSTSYFASKSFYLLCVTSIAIITPPILFSPSRNSVWRIGWVTVLLGIVVAVETLLLHQGPWQVNPFNANYLLPGRLLGITIIISTYYLFISKDQKLKLVVHIFLISLFSIALLILGARGPLLSLILTVAIIILLIINVKSIKYKLSLLYPFTLFGVVLIISLLSESGNFRAIRRLQGLSTEARTVSSSAGTRLDHYTWTIQQISLENILFGNGLGSWPVMRGLGDARFYPHNIFLEILFESGIFGLFIFILIIILVLRSLFHYSNVNEKIDPIILISIMIYMLLNANLTGDLNDNRVLFAIIGICVYYSNRSYLNKSV